MKSQISKGYKVCDGFLNWSRLRGEADSSDVRGRMQRRKDFKSSSKGLGFPGGAVVENPPANAGDTGSSPGPGGSHMPRSN